jgi:hypothetical protein
MADADGLMSAPPDVVHDAGNANTVSPDVAGAISAAMARVNEIGSDTLAAGPAICPRTRWRTVGWKRHHWEN